MLRTGLLRVTRARRITAEAVGTTLLLAAVVGSGAASYSYGIFISTVSDTTGVV